MGNERLRNAMVVAHLNIDALAKVTNVDPKTVQRWLHGRIPHARHRWKIAELLREHEEFLWPRDNTAVKNEHTAEVAAAYAHRSDISPSAWLELFAKAHERIDLLGYALLFIPEQNVNMVSLFKEKAAANCCIRIAIADPTSSTVKMRDEEEQLGGTLPDRIRTTLYHFRSLRSTNNIEIRYHSTVLYNSLFRADNEMFITPHLYGLHGSKAPLFYLRRLSPNGVFANFAAHFEAIWQTSTSPEEGTHHDTH